MKSVTAVAAMAGILAAVNVVAGPVVKDDKGNWTKAGVYFQLQYGINDPSEAPATDALLMRRLRPSIEGGNGENWKGKLELDLGKSKVDIREAGACYTGWKSALIKIGNCTVPFSREEMMSSRCKQLVESKIVGDGNYGDPSYQAGIHCSGNIVEDRLMAKLSLCKTAQDPDNRKIAFKSVVSTEKETDWSEGELVAGRLDWHPFGELAYTQGDFERVRKATFSIAGLFWQNDEDNLSAARSNDVDNVTGFEVSGGLRWKGMSLDAEMELMKSSLVDSGITSGLYEDSETTVNGYGAQCGYMVVADKLEAVVAFHQQDADSYSAKWSRATGGLNWFINKHDTKCQFMYTANQNKDGRDGSDAGEAYVQFQYVF